MAADLALVDLEGRKALGQGRMTPNETFRFAEPSIV
jgi:hypothetical protein